MPKLQAIMPEMLLIAETIQKKAGELLAGQRRVTTIAGGMKQDFSGALPNLMLDQLVSMGDQYDAMYHALAGYAKGLAVAAETYGATDEAIAKNIRAAMAAMGIGLSGLAAGVVTTGPLHDVITTGPIQEVITTGPISTQLPDRIPIDSDYYGMETGADGKWFEIGNPYNAAKNRRSMNCVQYARARAMEVNQKETFSPVSTGTELRANSVVKFKGGSFGHHEVYVERVFTDDVGVVQVVFSDSNMGSQPDGTVTTMPYTSFQNYTGARISSYHYF